MIISILKDAIYLKYGDFVLEKSEISLVKEVIIKQSKFLEFMQLVKDDKDLKFDILLDHTAVDYINENVFHLVYHLYSSIYNHQVIILVEVPRDKPVISTLCSIWRIAEWQEREVFDLFGILYNNHPDLRRIFLEDDWVGFPLRKNYKDNFMLEK
jgi:NADH-quinone oxidoreductase subunit C